MSAKIPIKGFRKRIIQRRHGQTGNLFRMEPFNGFCFLHAWNALPCAASVKKNYKRTLLVPPSARRRCSISTRKADGLKHFRQDTQGQLFLEFAHRSDLGSLARLNLTPREFPEAAMHRREMPLLHENFFVLIDKGDSSNEQGCQNFFQFR